jgi:hypothetical protein
VEVCAGDDRDGDDCRGNPVNDQAEGRPPSGVGYELAAVLPEVIEPVAKETGDDQPYRSGYGDRGGHNESGSDGAVGDDHFGRPSATAKPM